MIPKTAIAVIALGGIALCVGCKRKEEIRYQQTPKDSQYAQIAAAASGTELAGELPKGWVQVQADQIAYAAIQIGSGDKTGRVAITPMKAAGFEQMKLMNINRWRGFVGLPPLSDAGDVKFQPAEIAGEKGSMLDLSGNGKRTIAMWCVVGEQMWFVRIEGPAELVAAEKAKFDEFVQTLRFPGQATE